MSSVSSAVSRIMSLQLQARIDLDQGRYQQAEKALLKALSLIDRINCSRELDAVPLYNLLGIVYKYMGNFDGAAEAYRTCRQILRSNHMEDGTLAVLYHNLGGLEHSKGRYGLAERYARKGLTIREKVLGAAHPDTAADMAALAAILHERGKYEQAKDIYLQVLSIFRKLARRQSQYEYDVAINLNNIAATYTALGKTEVAETNYKKALKLKQRILGGDHPDLGMTLNNLATLYVQQKKFKKAEPLQLRCLALFEKNLGKQHPRFLAARRNWEKLQASLIAQQGLCGTG